MDLSSLPLWEKSRLAYSPSTAVVNRSATEVLPVSLPEVNRAESSSFRAPNILYWLASDPSTLEERAGRKRYIIVCHHLAEPPKIQRLLKIDTKFTAEDASFLVDPSGAASLTKGDQSLNKNATWIDEKVLMVCTYRPVLEGDAYSRSAYIQREINKPFFSV